MSKTYVKSKIVRQKKKKTCLISKPALANNSAPANDSTVIPYYCPHAPKMILQSFTVSHGSEITASYDQKYPICMVLDEIS